MPRYPKVLRELVSAFNGLTDRSDAPEDVLHYMTTLRKLAKWEEIGRGCTPDGAFLEKFDSDDWIAIDAIYEELQFASDSFALDDKLSRKFSNEFAKQRGRVVPPMVLAAAVVKRRKDAKLKTLKPKAKQGDLAFADIDAVTG